MMDVRNTGRRYTGHMEFRQVIEKRMAAFGWSRSELLRRLQGKVAKSTLHAFLAGDSEITSEKLEQILTAMGTWTVKWKRDQFSDNECARHMRRLKESYQRGGE